MENKQDGKRSKGRPKGNGPDERQLDLWNLGAAQAPAAAPAEPETVSRNPSQPIASNEVSNGSPTEPTVATSPNAAEIAAETAPAAASPRERAKPAPRPANVLSTPASRNLPPLTRRQHDLLQYLQERVQQGRRPPSLSEICRDLGLASRGSLHKQVVALVEAGLVEAMNGKQRGVRLVEAANDHDGGIPLLGAIAAGRPIEALIRDESITLPTWLRSAAPCFALRVKGDSMRDAGILDGDVVVVEQRQHARNGETVVALIDGESATLKRIEQKPGEIVLHAENPAYAPQRYRPEQVAIQGVLVAALRRY